MYKGNWEQNKWNIHSSGYQSNGSYSPGEKEDAFDYKLNEKYNSEKNKDEIGKDYQRKQEEKEKKEEEEKEDPLAEAIEQEIKPKYDKDNEIDDVAIQKKAADEIAHEIKLQPEKQKRKKNVRSIEEAINKAIKENKEIIVLDR